MRNPLHHRSRGATREPAADCELRDRNLELERELASRTAELELTRVEILERLAQVAEFHEDGSRQHACRVARTAALIATELGAVRSDVELIWRAAIVHDIGKIAVADEILLKPGKLTEAEFEKVKLHTVTGEAILSNARSHLITKAGEIAASHHERWDGQGYPYGLRSEQIPLAGRIVAIADVYDALTHERPYKDAWSVSDAVEEITDQAGRQFDPGAVAAFAGLDHPRLLDPVDESIAFAPVRG
jgi:putative two-component system response regulator